MPNHVYKILELTGSSPAGIEDAVNTAIVNGWRIHPQHAMVRSRGSARPHPRG